MSDLGLITALILAGGWSSIYALFGWIGIFNRNVNFGWPEILYTVVVTGFAGLCYFGIAAEIRRLENGDPTEPPDPPDPPDRLIDFR